MPAHVSSSNGRGDQEEGRSAIVLRNNVYRDGRGCPLVLVHAFPIDHRMWDACAERIAEISDAAGTVRFPIWAPDMPGSNGSQVPSPRATGDVAQDGSYPQALDALTTAYAELVRSAGFDKAVWVGLSMGGYVALDMQRMYPRMVAGLALCDTRATQDGEQGCANRLRIARECEEGDTVEPVMRFAKPMPSDSTVKQSPAFASRFAGWVRQQTPEGIAWRQRMAAGREDLSDQLAEITAPTAVVCGALDPSSPPQVMKAMAEKITLSDPTFTVVDDCGHFSALEYPDAVAKPLSDLMRRVLDAAE